MIEVEHCHVATEKLIVPTVATSMLFEGLASPSLPIALVYQLRAYTVIRLVQYMREHWFENVSGLVRARALASSFASTIDARARAKENTVTYCTYMASRPQLQSNNTSTDPHSCD